MRGILMLLLFVQIVKRDFPFVQLLVKPDWQTRWHCSSRSTTRGENLDPLQLFVASDKDVHSVEKITVCFAIFIYVVTIKFPDVAVCCFGIS